MNTVEIKEKSTVYCFSVHSLLRPGVQKKEFCKLIVLSIIACNFSLIVFEIKKILIFMYGSRIALERF